MYYFFKWNYTARNDGFVDLLRATARLRKELTASYPLVAECGLGAVLYDDVKWQRVVEYRNSTGRDCVERRAPTDEEVKLAKSISDNYELCNLRFGYIMHDAFACNLHLPIRDGFRVSQDAVVPHHRHGIRHLYGASTEQKTIFIHGLKIDTEENKSNTVRRLRRVADILEKNTTIEDVGAELRKNSLGVRLNVGSTASRMVGLWLCDKVYQLGNCRGAAKQAIREMTELDSYLALKMENVEDADLRFYLRRTQECINACEALPFVKRAPIGEK